MGLPRPRWTVGLVRRSGRHLALAGATLAFVVLGLAVLAPPGPHLPGTSRGGAVIWLSIAWLAFAVGARLVSRLPVRAAAGFILLGAVVFGVLAGLTPARSSDDVFRYSWDGRVQAAGISAYRYPPAAQPLAGLRDDFLWPVDGHWCVRSDRVDGGTDSPSRVIASPGAGPEASPGVSPGASLGASPGAGPETVAMTGEEVLVEGCTRINRPGVHTIYPPVAEALFVVVHTLTPGGAGIRGFQLLALVATVATTVVLLFGLRRTGFDPRRAVMWAWCPAVAVEAGGNGHIDVVAAGLAAAALLVLAGLNTAGPNARGPNIAGPAATGRRAGVGRRGLAGVLIGLAIGVKVTPVLLLPAVLRRGPVTVVASAIGAVAVVYLPHLWTVGGEVIGYLPGYLREEGYADGSRYALLTWLIPQRGAVVAAVGVLIVVGLAVAWAGDPDRPWFGAAVMVGVALLVSTPSYPWYALLLVAMVAWGAPAVWLGVAAAGYIAQYAAGLAVPLTVANRFGYGLAAMAIGLAWLHRFRVRRRGTALHARAAHTSAAHTRDACAEELHLR